MEPIRQTVEYIVKIQIPLDTHHSLFVKTSKEELVKEATARTFSTFYDIGQKLLIGLRKVTPLISYQIEFYDKYVTFTGRTHKLPAVKEFERIAIVEIGGLLAKVDEVNVKNFIATNEGNEGS